jgi:hypothetical protein
VAHPAARSSPAIAPYPSDARFKQEAAGEEGVKSPPPESCNRTCTTRIHLLNKSPSPKGVEAFRALLTEGAPEVRFERVAVS